MRRIEIPHYDATIHWLLQSQTPSICYLMMTRLLGMAEDNEEVISTRQRIPLSLPVNGILAAQHEEGYCE